jgi:hypothetical protein
MFESHEQYDDAFRNGPDRRRGPERSDVRSRSITRLALGFALALLAGLPIVSPPVASAATPLEGVLYEQHGETLQDKEVDQGFFLATAGGAVRLAEPQPETLIGQRVRIADTDASHPGLQGQARAIDPREHLLDAPPPGPQSVLVLILTTPDDPSPAGDDAESVRAQVFTDPGSTGAYYAQQSNGATTLVGRVNPAGDVLGPIALSSAIAGCPTDAIANEADARAAAMGYAPASYDHVVYLLPHSSECNFGGLGQLPGRRSWSNGYLFTGVLAHELGHNMGAHHANLLSCVDAVGEPTPYSSSCMSSEYGDPFDVMGSSTALMGAFHRYQIGQLPASQVVRLHASATVSVASSEDFASPTARLVLVPIKHPHEAVHEYFAIDARTPMSPFDGWSTGEPVTTGLTIRKVSEGGYPSQTQLIDMHPSGPVTGSPLQPGETFADPADGVTITASGDAVEGLQAAITVPAITDDVPPQPPAWLNAVSNASGVHMSWGGASDDVGVDHYRLVRIGAELGTTSGFGFDDPGTPSLTQATYNVFTVDTSGNESLPISATVSLVHKLPSSRHISLGSVIQRDRRRHLLVKIECLGGEGPCVGSVGIRARIRGRLLRIGGANYEISPNSAAKVAVLPPKRFTSIGRRRAAQVRASATVRGGQAVSRSCRLLPPGRSRPA